MHACFPFHDLLSFWLQADEDEPQLPGQVPAPPQAGGQLLGQDHQSLGRLLNSDGNLASWARKSLGLLSAVCANK